MKPNGSQTVSPASSTTYHLTAQGPGGTAEATARLTVSAPSAPPVEAPPQAEAPSPTEADLFQQNVKDIYFDYDKYDIRADDQPIITADAAFLAAHPEMKFTIEGHCDERGSTEYNLALGDNRANSAREALIKAGVKADRIKHQLRKGKTLLQRAHRGVLAAEPARSLRVRAVAPPSRCSWAGRLQAPRHWIFAESARAQDNTCEQNHCHSFPLLFY